MFKDRSEAGRLLARRLQALEGEDCVVLALPRGGVPVGYELALALHAPLDVIVARKLGAPGDPELALGAVVGGERVEAVFNEELIGALGVGRDYLDAELGRQTGEILRREKAFRGGRPPAALAGRTAVVVDDGVATGASVRAALRVVRRRGAKRVILAVPVAPQQAAAELSAEADEVVVLLKPEPFVSVGLHYEDFSQTSDEEVLRLLDSAGRRPGPGA